MQKMLKRLCNETRDMSRNIAFLVFLASCIISYSYYFIHACAVNGIIAIFRVATTPGSSWNTIQLLENVDTPGSQFFEKHLTGDSLTIHPFEAEHDLCAILHWCFRHFGE